MDTHVKDRSARIPLTDDEFKALKLIALERNLAFSALIRKALTSSASTRKAFAK